MMDPQEEQEALSTSDEDSSEDSTQNEYEAAPSAEQVEEDGDDTSALPLPLPREHSYLPGTSHPLHTSLSEQEMSLTSSIIATTEASSATPMSSNMRQQYPRGQHQYTTSSLRSSSHSVTEALPVMELSGVVLFPGSTFPLRCHEQAWKDYLGRQIASSRNVPGEAPPVRLGILTAQPPPAVAAASQQSPFTANNHQRRRSWTRQGFGPVRLRRLSEQLIRQLGDLEEDLSDNDNDNAEHNNQQQQVVRVETRSDDSVESVSEALNGQEDERREHQQASSSLRSSASSTASATTDRCGYIGRIGTILTVMNTHGDEADASVDVSSVWRPLEEQGDQLVLTCLATGRFRITNYQSSADEDSIYLHQRMRHRYFSLNECFAGVPTFFVEELHDTPLPAPPLQRRPFSSLPPLKRPRQKQDSLLRSLSMVTPIPEYVYQDYWPDRLVAMIRECMEESPTFAGCREALSKTSSDGCPNNNDDPVQTSYWMSSNLPLTQTQKLTLLELPSTIERLRFLHQTCREICRKEQEQTEPRIYCKVCSIPLSRARYMFTLSGAEGTTGAYVNEHGFVHQTTTIRKLSDDDDEDNLVYYTGEAETRDSWFPGYSWTIMSCRMCRCHLGWRFQSVSTKPQQQQQSDKNRPDCFYGLSAASISIVAPRRRPRNRTQRR